jgi:hypothetical protein
MTAVEKDEQVHLAVTLKEEVRNIKKVRFLILIMMTPLSKIILLYLING